MNAHLLHLEFALAASQALWACFLLLFWLLCHRRVKVRTYRGPRRRRGPLEATSCVRRHPRAKSDWVVQEVLYLASHLRGCRTIADVFNRRHGLWETVGHTYVWEVMRDHAREIRQLRRGRKRRPPIAIPVGHAWALDLTFFRSPEGFTFMVIGIIDAGSRKLLALKVIPRKCVFALLGHVFLAFSEHGLPEAIRTDNEAMFTSRPWLAMLGAMGIRARRGPPLQPWHNGRIERFWGTLKQAIGRKGWQSAQALQAALDSFARFFNKVRPHQGLNGLTPEEAWQGKAMADVQLAHAQGRCDEAVEQLLVGFHVRC